MRYTLLIVMFLLGCQNEGVNRTAQTFVNDSLIKEDKELRDSIKLVESLNKFYQLGRYSQPNNSVSFAASEKYCFVLLKATQTDYDGKEEYFNYCTKIQDFLNIGEDLKYKLMDNAQESYLGSPSGGLHKGRVTSRECFIFDTYQEASKEREKYLIRE